MCEEAKLRPASLKLSTTSRAKGKKVEQESVHLPMPSGTERLSPYVI